MLPLEFVDSGRDKGVETGTVAGNRTGADCIDFPTADTLVVALSLGITLVLADGADEIVDVVIVADIGTLLVSFRGVTLA